LTSLSFTAPAPPALHTLSLHDALPIYRPRQRACLRPATEASGRAGPQPARSSTAEQHSPQQIVEGTSGRAQGRLGGGLDGSGIRSEEHTSELQSRFDLVCRLLLEKKKQ